MSTAHYDALEGKHMVLETRIADEEHRPHPDTGVIADLKKQKLKIKEEMTAI